MSDLIVQFAVLWGIKLAEEYENGEENLRNWESDELLELFTGWSEEYEKSDYDDTIEFFDDKLEKLTGGDTER